MNDKIKSQIQSEMINAIFYYGSIYKTEEEIKKAFKDPKFEYKSVSLGELKNINYPIFYDVYTFKTAHFPIRNYIRKIWTNNNYKTEAQESFISIDQDVLMKFANEIGINLETNSERTKRFDLRRNIENKNDVSSWISGDKIWRFLVRATFLLIVIGILMRVFGITESGDDGSTQRYMACKNAGDMGDRWDCQDALKKLGV